MQTLTAPFTLWEIKSYLVNKHYFYDVNIQYTLFKMVHTLLKSNKRSIFNLCWVRHSNNKSCHSPLVSIVTPPNIFCFDFSLTSTFSFKSVVWPKGSWLPKMDKFLLEKNGVTYLQIIQISEKHTFVFFIFTEGEINW